MIISDRVSLCTQKKELNAQSPSDGEDEAERKEGNTVHVVLDCKVFVFHGCR